MEFETVYTIDDWWDGPVSGLADYGGRPHAYLREFDTGADDWSPVFELWPVDKETLRLARERWAIWLRWQAAFHGGRTDISTHPALPEERARYEELQRLLGERWERPPGVDAIRAQAQFRAPTEEEEGESRVQWTPLEPVPSSP
jgi:hypothetical protein